MYLYYDKYNNLKEVINDATIVASANKNKVFAYYEKVNQITISTVTMRIKQVGGSYDSGLINLTQASTGQKTIPFDENRDLKLFDYYKDYNFYIGTIPNNLSNGTYYGSIIITTTDATNIALTTFTFNVENNSVLQEERISNSDYIYLLSLIQSGGIISNAKITLTQSGVEKGDFTLNQANDKTIALDTGGGATYTAGDGINISAGNEISTKVGSGLFYDDQDRIAFNNLSQANISWASDVKTKIYKSNNEIVFNDGTNAKTLTQLLTSGGGGVYLHKVLVQDNEDGAMGEFLIIDGNASQYTSLNDCATTLEQSFYVDPDSYQLNITKLVYGICLYWSGPDTYYLPCYLGYASEQAYWTVFAQGVDGYYHSIQTMASHPVNVSIYSQTNPEQI